MDTCLDATDSVYGLIGYINERGTFDTTTIASTANEDCAFPAAMVQEVTTGMNIRGIWGQPMLTGEPLICNDLQAHPDRVGLPEGHVPLHCFLGVPLKLDGAVTGMIAVANKRGGYVDADRATLIRLAAVISLSRRHRQALGEARRTSAELERIVEEKTRALKEAQAELVRKEKLAVLGQLAGGVAHELRNPLGAVKNAAYFLNMVLDDPEPDVKESLEIMNKEVATTERIIEGLLDYARPKRPVRRKVKISDVIEEVLARWPLPDTVEVVRVLNEALPDLQADPDQLIQIFSNIVLNAGQAMPSGGSLVITAETSDPGWVTVSIRDTGAGVPRESQGKLFEPLFTTKAIGIGLGLAVTRTLVENHGGMISIESEEGIGATFVVRLPTHETDNDKT